MFPCPFCSAPNPSDATQCHVCARRLPPRLGDVGITPVGRFAAVGEDDPTAISPLFAPSVDADSKTIPGPLANAGPLPGRPGQSGVESADTTADKTLESTADATLESTTDTTLEGTSDLTIDTGNPISRSPSGTNPGAIPSVDPEETTQRSGPTAIPTRQYTGLFANSSGPTSVPGPAAEGISRPMTASASASTAPQAAAVQPPATVETPPVSAEPVRAFAPAQTAEVPSPIPTAAHAPAVAQVLAPADVHVDGDTDADPGMTREIISEVKTGVTNEIMLAPLPAAIDRTFKPPDLRPIPPVPEPGIFNTMRYATAVSLARWQRRSAIKQLKIDITDSTAGLDELLGMLGRRARELGVERPHLAAENAALRAAEERRGHIEQTRTELRERQESESRSYTQLENERVGHVSAAEAALARGKHELTSLEAQRRGMREKRKTLQRQQKDYLKAAENREEQAAKASEDEARAELTKAAEEFRRDAAALDPECEDLERRIADLDKPIAQAVAKVESLQGALDATRQGLNEVRESHRHRQAEIEAEQGRRNRELSQAEAEIQRRLISLGTLIDLHRIGEPAFAEIYERIDRSRSAIGVRSTEIDRLAAEREAYDRNSLARGFAGIGTSVFLLVLIAVLLSQAL